MTVKDLIALLENLPEETKEMQIAVTSAHGDYGDRLSLDYVDTLPEEKIIIFEQVADDAIVEYVDGTYKMI